MTKQQLKFYRKRRAMIQRLIKRGIKQIDIARQYKISPQRVSQLVNS